MTTAKFTQQIEYLLWTGALRGEAILELHLLLKFYQQGAIGDEQMQAEIEKYDPATWEVNGF